MSHNCLANSNLNFHVHLYDLDVEAAKAVKPEGCPHCNGKLHQSHYPRIGFGIATQLAPLYEQRFSFCCSDCRTRVTPPSVRFFGRRRFVASIFILLCASHHFKPNEPNCLRLARRLGFHLSLSTWKRWRAWWQKTFPNSRFWATAKARFSSLPDVTPCPRALLKSFAQATLGLRLVAFLRFLSPLTLHPI